METYTRVPNCTCTICDKPLYRRPKGLIHSEGRAYCSKICFGISCRNELPCRICGTLVLASKHARTCSRACANIARAGIKYKRTAIRFPNSTAKRLYDLRAAFSEFKNCMISGCDYNTTYDIHRHVEGKNGGKYEIGNMFAICPNHHAEITRKLITVEKVNDYTLKII